MSTGPTWDWHQNGAPFRRQDGLYGQVETRSDYRIGMGVSGGKYDRQTDLVYSVNLAGGVSNRFRNYSLNLSTGKEADKPYSSIGPGFSLRMFKKLDLVLNSFLQNYQGVGQQHVLTFNYELSPTRSWGGRVVLQDADTNWYLAYRNAGHTGTETYFIIGDPNSARFTRQALLKVVFAL
ncbi:MAG: hypothetical protein LC772_08820 [Chloroflexi bacterium]|nr:hypothetical protein [Chloroflexota bacterium]